MRQSPGIKCEFQLCRVCCKDRCYNNDRDCPGHGIFIKSRRARAKLFEEHIAPQDHQKVTRTSDDDLTIAPTDAQEPL